MTIKPNYIVKLESSFSIKRAAGFSLFELVAFIIAVAIIYSVAANRFSQFPGAAERANFMAVTMQIQTGVNFEAMRGASRVGPQGFDRYESSNPMDILLAPPSNYIGAFDIVDKSRLPGRTWYFDLASGELVYLVGDVENVFFLLGEARIPTDEIRFRVAVNYSFENRETGIRVSADDITDASSYPGSEYNRRFDGLLMEPVTPYIWERSGVSLPDVAVADSAD